MKVLLSIGKNGHTQKFFVMGNHGQVKNTPYFNTMKEATIYMFRMNSKEYTNIYDMAQKEYEQLTSNR